MAPSDMRADAAPADGRCPHCGGALSLADLARLAIGDGWERHLIVDTAPGARAIVPMSTLLEAAKAVREGGAA